MMKFRIDINLSLFENLEYELSILSAENNSDLIKLDI